MHTVQGVAVAVYRVAVLSCFMTLTVAPVAPPGEVSVSAPLLF